MITTIPLNASVPLSIASSSANSARALIYNDQKALIQQVDLTTTDNNIFMGRFTPTSLGIYYIYIAARENLTILVEQDIALLVVPNPWDNVANEHLVDGSTGQVLNVLGSKVGYLPNAGGGPIPVSIQIFDDNKREVLGALVVYASDSQMVNVLAQVYTDSEGFAVANLPKGTYYRSISYVGITPQIDTITV